MLKKIIKSNIKKYFEKPKYISLKSYKNIRIKYSSFFKNIFIFIFYISGVIFYILSLTHIEGLGMTCFSGGGIECYYKLAKFTFISSLITSFSLYIIIYNNYNKIHFFLIIIIYLLLYLIDHHKDIVIHGFYNFVGFSISTSMLFSLLFFLRFLWIMLKSKNYILLFLVIFPIPFFYVKLKNYKLNHFSCHDWNKGLNNTYIDNVSKDYPCIINIPRPHSCYLSEIGPYFDFTAMYKPTCLDKNILKKEKLNFLKDFQSLKYSELSQRNHFGFPLTNVDEFIPDEYGNACYAGNKSFEEDIYKRVILMDLFNKDRDRYYPNISKPEIEVIFKGNVGKIIINIEKNETLINNREKIIKKRKNKIQYKNVLIMFFDTLSRAHFFRKFKKTTKFLEQFSKYETNLLKKNMSIFQYFKYNSINSFTAPNLVAAYYGGTIDGNGTHFGNHFKNNGYIIGRANSLCEKEVVINKGNIKKFKHCKFDHEGLSIGCIKGFYDGPFLDRISSLVKRCLFGKDLTEYSLEYLESFWNTYIDQHKMFLYQSTEGHEPTGELIGHYDDIYFHFLNKFYKNGLFKDTAIILFSDHGEHLSGPLYLFNSEDFFFERTLPILFLIIPNNEFLYKNNLYEIMKYNEQIFITPFDIYNTLIYLSNDNKENLISYGDSLFTKLKIEERFCDSPKYENHIKEYACNCINKKDNKK